MIWDFSLLILGLLGGVIGLVPVRFGRTCPANLGVWSCLGETLICMSSPVEPWFLCVYVFLSINAWSAHKIVLQVKTKQFYEHIRAQPDWTYIWVSHPDRTRRPNLPDMSCQTGLAPNLYYEVICVYVSQQVEVAQLLSQIVKNLYIKTDGSRGLVFLKSDANLRATFQNYFGERALWLQWK